MENKYKGVLDGFAYYEAKDEQDLKDLHSRLVYMSQSDHMSKAISKNLATSLEENHPEVFNPKIKMEFTQEEVDKLALIMGHVVNEYKLLSKFEGLTSKDIETENGLTNYDLMTYNADSEDGLTIRFDF